MTSRLYQGWGSRARSMLVGLVAIVSACGNRPAADDAGDVSSRWQCPSEWVPSSVGGCGPAVILCAPDGGAMSGACDGVDLTTSHTVDAGEAGSVQSFRRTSTGEIAGGWPASDFAPDAGIPSCPMGWTRTSDGTCDPNLRNDCPTDAEGLPGATCTLTGIDACGTSAFPTAPPESAGATLVRVQSGAMATGADGSEAHPYPTIAAGLAAASDNDWILVAAGNYVESLAITHRVHIVGLCASRTVIEGSGAATTPTIDVPGATLDLRSVSVHGAFTGVRANSGAQVTLSGVRIDGAAQAAVASLGAGTHVVAASSVFANTRAAAGYTYAPGVDVERGASFEGTGVVVSGNIQSGVYVSDSGSSVHLRGAVLRDTTATSPRPKGEGLRVQFGATALAEETVVQGNVSAGVMIDENATVTVRDAVLRDTHATSTGMLGYGVHAQTGATVSLERVLVEANVQAGIASSDMGTMVTVTDSVVRNTMASADLTQPSGGVLASQGGALTATGVRVDGNEDYGVVAFTGPVVLENAVVSHTHPRPADGQGGYGIAARTGGTLTATSVLVVGNDASGGFAQDTGSTLTLEDSVVRDTARGGAPIGIGYGIDALAQSVLNATRVRIDDNVTAGVLVVGATATLVDSAVLATRSGDDGRFGRGVEVQSGYDAAMVLQPGSIHATHLFVSGVHETGISAFVDGSLMSLSDSIVADVLPSARGFGSGVAVFAGGDVTLDRVAVVDTHGAAMLAVPSSEIPGAMPERIEGNDVFVRGVSPSTIRFSTSGTTVVPEGEPAAYAIHLRDGANVRLSQTVLWDAAYGFFASAASLSMERSVVADMTGAFGVTNGSSTTQALSLSGIAQSGNANDMVIVDTSLPEGASLEPETPVCGAMGCQ